MVFLIEAVFRETSLAHFPPNFGEIAYCVAQSNAAISVVGRTECLDTVFSAYPAICEKELQALE